MIAVRELEADVVVVGGGIAGCLAAIGAAERSARVVVLDKATLPTGGDGATGMKFIMTWIPGEGATDTPDELFQRLWERSLKLDSRTRLRRYAEEVWPMIQRLERMGVRFRHREQGKYVRYETMGFLGSYLILFDGRDFKKIIARRVADLGVTELNQTVGVSVLKSADGVAGVVAFDFRNDCLLAIKSHAVVLAAGHACRLYNGVAGSPYNTWHSPYNTGDATAMAYRAGAKLANVEFLSATLVPKGYGIPGLAALVGMGGHLINAAGERFMPRYHPRAERAPRCFLVQGVYQETNAGGGPCFVDCRHLSSAVLDDMFHHLMIERGMWEDYFDQANVDLRSRPMEIEIGELHSEHGVLVDQECASSVPGLYAAGECAGSANLSRCCVEGYRAGANAARRATGPGETGANGYDHQVGEVADRLHEMLSPVPGAHYRELEQSVRETMTTHVGIEKHEHGLAKAVNKLEALRNKAYALRAKNSHEVLRSLEAQNLFECALFTAEASQHRRESRMGAGGSGELFWRSDYPEHNSPEWERLVTIRQEAGTRVVELEPVPA